jgi:hypothetical protein
MEIEARLPDGPGLRHEVVRSGGGFETKEGVFDIYVK